jgi:hypothetical protein
MATLTRPRSCALLTGIVAIEVASPAGDTQATWPFLPVVIMLPSGRYAKSVRSYWAWPDAESISRKPAGSDGAADAILDLTMTMAVVTEVVTSAAAINLRNCIKSLPNPARGSTRRREGG